MSGRTTKIHQLQVDPQFNPFQNLCSPNRQIENSPWGRPLPSMCEGPQAIKLALIASYVF